MKTTNNFKEAKEEILKIRNKYTKKVEDAKTLKQFEKAVNDFLFKEEDEIYKVEEKWRSKYGNNK